MRRPGRETTETDREKLVESLLFECSRPGIRRGHDEALLQVKLCPPERCIEVLTPSTSEYTGNRVVGRHK